MASATGIMKAALVMVVKKARKVLIVTPIDRDLIGVPSCFLRTATIATRLQLAVEMINYASYRGGGGGNWDM
jgi:hypothetical protein